MKKYPDILLMLILLASMLMYSFSFVRHLAPDSNSKKRSPDIQIPDSLFQSGDMIFRNGRGFISHAFRRLSLTDPQYSHTGIIHRESGNLFVYHLIGGEGNSNNYMRKDKLIEFCSNLQSDAFAVFRTDQDGDKIDSLAGLYYSKHISFDSEFSLVTDDKMYCTEFLYKVLTIISGESNFITLTHLSGFTYVSCDNICLSPHLKKLYSYKHVK